MTRVYRIQDAEGRGPYRPGFSGRWTDDDHHRNPPFYVEFGLPIGSIAKRFKMDESGGCAFRKIDDLTRWFSVPERSKLEGLGYFIASMEVDRIIAESRNQVVFARRKPLWTDYLLVPWPAAPAARSLELTSQDDKTP